MNKISMAFFVGWLALAQAAFAQDAAHPCRADAEKLCPDAVKASDRAAAKACLLKHLDQVSEVCKARLK